MVTSTAPRLGNNNHDDKAALAMLAAMRAFMRERIDMPAQYIVTFLLVATNEGLSVSDYAHRASVSKSVMSRHILDLSIRQRNGEPGLDLLHTKTSPMNLRTHEVYLTAKGRSILQAMTDAWRMTQ